MNERQLAVRLVKIAKNLVAAESAVSQEKGEEFRKAIKRALPKYKAWLDDFAPVGSVDVKHRETGHSWSTEITFNQEGDDYTKLLLGCRPDNPFFPEAQKVYKYYYEATVLASGKKYRVNRTKYEDLEDLKELANPKKLFPAKRMKRIYERAAAERGELKPRDFIALIERKFGAENYAKDFWKIPLGDDYYMAIYRATIMRTAVWGVNGVYHKFKRVERGDVYSIPETLEGIDKLGDLVKRYQREFVV